MFIRRRGYGGYGRRRGPLSARLIIGLVIAAVGVISYLTKTQTNPVTGEKQRVAMTAEQEIRLGIRAAPQMVSQMGGVYDPRSEPRAATVARIGRELVEKSDARKSPYVRNFSFHLVRDPGTVNAFALPGGKIFITAALYDRLENEAQLAGVLGHEIGHVIHRHGAEHMASGQLGQMLVTAVAVGTSDRDEHYMATMAAQMANQIFQLKYSRADELESDSTGLSYMRQAGYDPSAMLKVMEILKAASGKRGAGPDILATHPNPDARIQQIKAYLGKAFPSGVPPDLRTGLPLRGGPMQLER